ncbi:hypothetical protein, partial [Anaerobacillus sp. 1_MG-2023]|uniref:hypothetical protein n=1 Tax=Anaerobacillus sp. 1_MG-2023 TaxID=3062655 RepID=UPI0026E2D9B5
SSAYKVTYETRAKDRVYTNEKITNDVTAGTESSSASRNIGQQILSKSFNNVDYQNQELSWNITVNSDNQIMKNLVLSDDFTNEGLTLID